jgi:hypothetical protein
MKLVQHLELDPSWPTHGRFRGRPILLADVEKTLRLVEYVEVEVDVPGGGTIRPWKGVPIVAYDDDGNVYDPKRMERRDLESVGLTDERLSAAYLKEFGGDPAQALRSSDYDLPDLQIQRRAWYDRLMAKAYNGT